ncbi:MBL fold metallo-hydrolase [Paenibacillus sp.]|jgi:glyoxylase-like metal-dependent hydrolase (beta-lactamase superfamily II)|uniref:MBL fold metallo-hydrolase n=1 Tax=Paenibacillus sp. TaxID=58172 RepID=UPI0028349C1F|nr:MBL fold metallo-hydrolase [Paenibacillus sp.]MDR0270747.1 MBL fold metallo-hydrolase [Paenibacillus sp.]
MKKTTVHQITQLSFMPRMFPVNVYLVEEEDDLTLVDAGMPFSVKGILKATDSLGKPITRILLTHAHGDHVGALDALKDTIPTAEVYISRRDQALLTGSRALEEGEPQTPVRGDVPKKIRTKPDHLIMDGDLIGSLMAVASPGHTPGHMAFLDTRSKVLIAGDAFQIRGGMAVSGHMQPLFPFPAMATWNKDAALASARRLTALQPTWLAVGHGQMLEKPTDSMSLAVERAEEAFKGGK